MGEKIEMTRKFLIFSSTSFMPRALVTYKSVCQHYYGEVINVVQVNDAPPGKSYIEGLAKFRLECVKESLKTFDEVVVLGADCVLYDKIDTFLNMPGKVVLIPHVVTPPSNNAQYYPAGHVNADLILFRKSSLDVLDWLLTQEFKDNQSGGSFYEQTLLSSLPFFFDDISICKDPSINYAYFNMSERMLYYSNDKPYVIDTPYSYPLKMAQFSGYVVGEPNKISKYFSGFPIPSDAIIRLFKEYEDSIVAEQNSKWVK